MRRRIFSTLFASTLVLALVPAAVADEHREIDDVHAEIGLPDQFALGEPERVSITFENRTEWDITDAVVGMTMRIDDTELDASAVGVSGPIDGEQATFDDPVAEYTASLPDDGGFTIGAGETVELDLDITIDHTTADSGQLEVRVSGEIDGEMTSDGSFQDFTVTGVQDTDDEEVDEEADRPEAIPAGSAGLAADGGVGLPLLLGLLGAALLALSLVARRPARQRR
jgi:hypothetical protein